jgi:membrane peptidoglycan carboxypeptidase
VQHAALHLAGQISTDETSGYQSWFIDYVIEEVIADLKDEYGWTYQHAEEELYNGGYRIYATVDNRVQGILEDFYENSDNFPQMRNEIQPDSCFVILNYDGELVAMVGGRGEKTVPASLTSSRTATTPRFAIKPISSYALAIERDLITYSTVIKMKRFISPARRASPRIGRSTTTQLSWRRHRRIRRSALHQHDSGQACRAADAARRL